MTGGDFDEGIRTGQMQSDIKNALDRIAKLESFIWWVVSGLLGTLGMVALQTLTQVFKGLK